MIELVVFDKDGTLINFHAMWGDWIAELARRLEAAAGMALAEWLFQAVQYDPLRGVVDPRGPLAIAAMADLRGIVTEVLRAAGLSAARADEITTQVWYIPDPVALAQPLADLPALFRGLRERGARIAIATTDDRAPTQATMEALGIAPFVAALACGDDGIPLKPAPDMILALCRDLGVAPAHAAMVGDTTADLLMGQTAGAGLLIGVLSGLGSAEMLGLHADLLLPSVAELRIEN